MSTLPPEIHGREHLFRFDDAERWFNAGGDPNELWRSNPQGSRRPQPAWTFWWAHAQSQTSDADGWRTLVQAAVTDPRFDPWVPDQNGDPCWWQTMRGLEAPYWSHHWRAQGLDPNRWNEEPSPAYPCLLAMWLATGRETGTLQEPVRRLAEPWINDHGLNLHAIDPRTGDGAWHWLGLPRGRTLAPNVTVQTVFATWLIDQGVSPEPHNHAGVSGWDAWSTACNRPAAWDTVHAHWARVETTQLRTSLDRDVALSLPPVLRAARRL